MPKDILEFIQQNPICTFATTETDQPHVRAFLSNIINNKIYFTSSTYKNVGKQILQNPKVELCYLNSDFSKMLRITTTIIVVDDKKIKQDFIDEREYLKDFLADDPSFLLLTLSHSKARFWSLGNNMKESEIKEVLF
ncbi:MAG TPA: hypothetical protein ENK91_11525 [Bacteroidetes bacterium]|nr:hypothetical protein [Bacteroidota bacterium]